MIKTHSRAAHRRDSALAVALPIAPSTRPRKKSGLAAPKAPVIEQPPPILTYVPLSPRLAAACGDLAVGLEAVAKHAPGLALEVSSLIASFTATGARRGSRLRWEWLASTGSQMDGSPDARMLAECASLADRILADLARQPKPDEALRQAAIRVHLLTARNVPPELLGMSL